MTRADTSFALWRALTLEEWMMISVSLNQVKLDRWNSEFRGAIPNLDKAALERLLQSMCATATHLSAPLFESQTTALHQLLQMSTNQRTLPPAALEMAILLVQRGASLDVKDGNGASPLDCLMRKAMWTVINTLLDAEDALLRKKRKVA